MCVCVCVCVSVSVCVCVCVYNKRILFSGDERCLEGESRNILNVEKHYESRCVHTQLQP